MLLNRMHLHENNNMNSKLKISSQIFPDQRKKTARTVSKLPVRRNCTGKRYNRMDFQTFYHVHCDQKKGKIISTGSRVFAVTFKYYKFVFIT